jgi:hypothetical protein
VFSLDQVNEALVAIKNDSIDGAAVIVPWPTISLGHLQILRRADRMYRQLSATLHADSKSLFCVIVITAKSRSKFE